MSSGERQTVLDFFAGVGARVSVPRETLSRLLRIAYPTLDPVLAGLKADGFLETNTFGQWRPVRGFNFVEVAQAAREAARKRVEEREAKRNERKARIDAARDPGIKKQIKLAEKQYTKDTTGRPAPAAPIPVSGKPPAPAPDNDPWVRIRERHYGKPVFVEPPGDFRQLTPQELMTGRVRRRA